MKVFHLIHFVLSSVYLSAFCMFVVTLGVCEFCPPLGNSIQFCSFVQYVQSCKVLCYLSTQALFKEHTPFTGSLSPPQGRVNFLMADFASSWKVSLTLYTL